MLHPRPICSDFHTETVSLTSDVDSVYANVPIGYALHRVVRKLDNKAHEYQLVVQLLRIQLAHNYFAFQCKSCQQVRGLPMAKAWHLWLHALTRKSGNAVFGKCRASNPPLAKVHS